VKFKNKDRVKVISVLNKDGEGRVGDEGTISGDYINGGYGIVWDIKDRSRGFTGWYKLKKLGDKMSLRTRIEALDNGWDKEADDILQEIIEDINPHCAFEIGVVYVGDSLKTGYFRITCKDFPERVGQYMDSLPWAKEIRFDDQCSKMKAFKEALLWLLDKSGLEGHKKGDTIKIESEGKTYKVKILEEV